MLDHLVAIYRTTFHLQPLPLFSLDYLQTRLISAPEYLLNSFLALTVPFSDHEFYSGDKKATAIRLYTRSAENLVMSLAFDGAPRLEAEQCLCLLAMNNMLGQYNTESHNGACIDIPVSTQPQQGLDGNRDGLEARNITLNDQARLTYQQG